MSIVYLVLMFLLLVIEHTLLRRSMRKVEALKVVRDRLANDLSDSLRRQQFAIDDEADRIATWQELPNHPAWYRPTDEEGIVLFDSFVEGDTVADTVDRLASRGFSNWTPDQVREKFDAFRKVWGDLVGQ